MRRFFSGRDLNNFSNKISIRYVDTLHEHQVQGKTAFKIIQLEVTLEQAPTTKKIYVNHAHFIAWPDHGIPDSPQVMIEFINAVRKYDLETKRKNTTTASSSSTAVPESTNSSTTSLVHCSAGIGRTGTYIVIDQCMHHFQRHKNQQPTHHDVTKEKFVYDLSLSVRSQRALAIQTQDQYSFCYKAVKYFVEKLHGDAHDDGVQKTAL